MSRDREAAAAGCVLLWLGLAVIIGAVYWAVWTGVLTSLE